MSPLALTTARTRSRVGVNRSRRPPFLDRIDERRAFESQLELYRDAPDSLTVLEVVGLGGMGKTRLLSELRKDARRNPNRTRHVLGVVPLSTNTKTTPLRRLREDCRIDCLLFDMALLAYYSATKEGLPIERGSRLSRSPVIRSLDVGTDVAAGIHPLAFAVSLPAKFAIDFYDTLSHQYKRHRHYVKDDFTEIEDMRDEPEEILRRLPSYLGSDIQRTLELSGGSLVAFYDAYDRQAADILANDSRWLRDFIQAVTCGLHVIATREPLGWPQAHWRETVRNIPITTLPQRESQEMLRARLGKLDLVIETRLVQASGRVPFFVETVSDTYENLARKRTKVEVDDLPASPEEAISHLIAHLPDGHRRLAVALGAIQVFDEGLFRYLVHQLNLTVDVLTFAEFTKRYFIEEIHSGLYRTHDLFTEFVRCADEQYVQRSALEQATRHLLARSQDAGLRSPDTVLELFFAIITGWESIADVPPASVAELVDAGYVLYDAGYWIQLASMRSGGVAAREHPVGVVRDFFVALAARRVEGIDRASDLFERLLPRAETLGRHKLSVQLELAYLSELSGDYVGARRKFAKLNDEAQPFKPTDRTHMRSRLWHADMLIMDGELQNGSRLLLEAYEELDNSFAIEKAELIRHRAHAFRFSYLLDHAERLYGESMQLVSDVWSMQGKLHTNLVETRCWHDPKRALDAAELSSECNLRLGNKIELAKCEAARAIALAKLSEPNAAREAVAAAKDHALAAGYRAGVAFALQASAIVEGLAHNTDGLLTSFDLLAECVRSLGTYSHLLVAPARLLEEDDEFIAAAIDVEWLESDTFEERLGACLLQRPCIGGPSNGRSGCDLGT